MMFCAPQQVPRLKNPMDSKSQRGQGLVEYLIIVALVAIASIAVMRVLGQNVTAQFGRITNALQGEGRKPRLNKVQQNFVQKKDLGTFMQGAASDEDSGGSSQNGR